MSGWHEGPLISFDLETTGVDVETERIVTASRWLIRPAQKKKACCTWLVNPGIPIPEQATKIHKITNEMAREYQAADEAVREIAADLVYWLAEAGAPVIAYNARYDLSLLHRECLRYGHTKLADQVAAIRPVVDPMILDKRITKKRRGSGRRKLVAVAEIYGVPLGDDAHGSQADSLAAARLAYLMAARNPEVADMTADQLHDAQIEWAREQFTGLAAWYRDKGRTADADGVRFEWPFLPAPQITQEALA